MRSYKVLAALLTYPEADLCAAARSGELLGILENERLLNEAQIETLRPLVSELSGQDELDLQEHYVRLFDQSKSRSLYLFEHLHGESRDRGQAMVDLTRMYAEAGLVVAENELPDFLPLFLEYLSELEPAEACRRLGQPIHIIATLARRLESRGSVYAPVLALLEQISVEKADSEAIAELLDEPDDDIEDTDRLDAEWTEEPVLFGPGATPDAEAPCQRVSRAVAGMARAGGAAD